MYSMAMMLGKQENKQINKLKQSLGTRSLVHPVAYPTYTVRHNSFDRKIINVGAATSLVSLAHTVFLLAGASESLLSLTTSV